MSNLIWIILAIIVGGGIGYALRKFQAQKQTESAESQASKLMEDTKSRARELLLQAKDEALRIKEEAKKDEEERRNSLIRIEEKLSRREEVLEGKIESLEKDKQELQDKGKEIETLKEEILEIKENQKKKLEKVAKLSLAEAKKLLLEMTEKDMKEELVAKIKELETQAKEEADRKAQKIISLAIQRCATSHTAESTVATVNLPSDEMKGRIIGREGRNIHAFEKATGVDVIVDDTPEAVVISCFDPVRREIARIALEKLIVDGRIHPSRIEETISEAKKQVAEAMREAGEAAVYEVGIVGLPTDLVKLLGRLKYRTSYGQNVLRHSIEVAHLSGMLAAELNADVNVTKKAGLLHDIGKGLDQEIPGNHQTISRDIAKKFGLDENVVHAIESHHEDVPFKTTEAILVQTADAISSVRPGARRESLESYVKRLAELENIANSFPGVEKSFAIQAGREVRIIVKSEEIDDLESIKLAKNIASKIEKDLNYPGQIKVNVIRETRATEIAK